MVDTMYNLVGGMSLKFHVYMMLLYIHVF